MRVARGECACRLPPRRALLLDTEEPQWRAPHRTMPKYRARRAASRPGKRSATACEHAAQGYAFDLEDNARRSAAWRRLCAMPQKRIVAAIASSTVPYMSFEMRMRDMIPVVH